MTLALNRIHNMPALEMFAALPEQAALIVADPPYGVSYESNWKDSMTSRKNHKPIAPRHDVEFFGDSAIDISWLTPAYNALQEGGAMYLFTRWDVMHHWHSAARDAGFKVSQCIVWDKDMMSMGDLSSWGSQTEFILFCTKGKHTLRWDKRQGNLWRVSRGEMMNADFSKDERKWRHPTQKPTRLMAKIITYSSDVGDLVVDPFTGSGAACIAAQRLHRRFVGCDISPTFAAASQAWVEKDAPHTLPMMGF